MLAHPSIPDSLPPAGGDGAPFVPETAPFTADQRLWLNGYLAGLLAGRGYVRSGTAMNPAAEPAAAAVPLLILYGSQTGTAEKLARQIAREAKPHGCAARVVDAAAHTTIDWSRETNVLVVTSTYGDGDMPDNAQEFWNWLQTEAAATLAHVNYSVLALGDTNYEQFCAAGKKIDARLEALGAKRLHPLADCDVDYEAKVKSWLAGALPKIGGGGNGAAAAPAATATVMEQPVAVGTPAPAARPAYSKTNPFPARLVVNRKLNLSGSEKEVRHFAISLAGSDLKYEAGDALGIWPANDPALVKELLHALQCDGEEAVPVPGGELPLRKALLSVYDITKPTPELIERAGANSAVIRQLLPPENREQLRQWLWGRDVLDLLRELAPARLAPGEFVALLKRLAPRLYSISSSPRAHAGEVHLTVNIVRHASYGRVHRGVASTFLAERVDETTPVPVYIQPSHGFRLPASGDTPIIMVGPGTGVAPFRGFLHDRRATGAKGRNWLFFGEQRAATDFYYAEELQPMLADGHLTRLDTAFSRDQEQKIYVQHRLLEHAAEVWSWLQEGAHFYVCGDASRMAKDVDAALHRIAETAGGLSPDAAVEYLRKLKTDKRYQRDVY